MNDHFAAVIRSLEPSFQRLIAMHPVKPSSMPPTTPKAGIYLLSEGNHHLYVGRTRDIKGRIGRHCKPGATHRMAAFAFRLAREATGNLTATYKQEGSRSALMDDPPFRKAFDEGKKRIREMDLRFVQEDDPVRQAVLEIYVAVALQTPYNDFDTH
jgi:predicted GIY-YIG superfamily endonuclease